VLVSRCNLNPSDAQTAQNSFISLEQNAELSRTKIYSRKHIKLIVEYVIFIYEYSILKFRFSYSFKYTERVIRLILLKFFFYYKSLALYEAS
jgi:hypothetical protein